MRGFISTVLIGLSLLLAGCDEQKAEAPAAPYSLTAEAMGHFCGMQLLEHPGPKGQVILRGVPHPMWFSSARDAFAFTFLPEEAKNIRAIYVSDMAQAPSWADPGAENWIDARAAYFVLGSRLKGGMGADETIPFSSRAAAESFAALNGGRVLTFAEVPHDYVLGSGGADAEAPPRAAQSGS